MHARTHTGTRTHSQGAAGAGVRSLSRNCNCAPPCQCFCLALSTRRPHRQSALLPSSRRLKLGVGSAGGREGWRGVRVVGGRLWGIVVVGGLGDELEGRGGVGGYEKRLTLGCIAVCVVIKCLSLTAGVRGVTHWRWYDAVRFPHTHL